MRFELFVIFFDRLFDMLVEMFLLNLWYVAPCTFLWHLVYTVLLVVSGNLLFNLNLLLHLFSYEIFHSENTYDRFYHINTKRRCSTYVYKYWNIFRCCAGIFTSVRDKWPRREIINAAWTGKEFSAAVFPTVKIALIPHFLGDYGRPPSKTPWICIR